MDDETKVQVHVVDMEDSMKQHAIDTALKAANDNVLEKDIAAAIKREFDKTYGLVWHCVVGTKFGSLVTHESKNFIYFYIGKRAIMLFKTTW